MTLRVRSASGLEQALRPAVPAGRPWRHGRVGQPRAACPPPTPAQPGVRPRQAGLATYRGFGSGPERARSSCWVAGFGAVGPCCECASVMGY